MTNQHFQYHIIISSISFNSAFYHAHFLYFSYDEMYLIRLINVVFLYVFCFLDHSLQLHSNSYPHLSQVLPNLTAHSAQ